MRAASLLSSRCMMSACLGGRSQALHSMQATRTIRPCPAAGRQQAVQLQACCQQQQQQQQQHRERLLSSSVCSTSYGRSSRGSSNSSSGSGSSIRGSVRHISIGSGMRRGPIRMHAAAAVATVGPPAPPREQVLTSDPANNVSDYIYSKMGTNLHHQPNHPISIIKEAIYSYFDTKYPGLFRKFDDLHPIVSTTANFDEVLVPVGHVSRSPNDTYYVSSDTCLRCHTSAHQAETLRKQEPAFLITGDVYRRDSIDATHYPVFHQMEGVRVFSPTDWEAAGEGATPFAERELKHALEGLAQTLFGNVECRWIDAYFPFTDPSFELEIFFNGKWLEVLGCGVMEQAILDQHYGPGHKAWAFGLGLERLAMVLFDIPDIRLFWSGDERFLRQFKAGNLGARFKSYSKYPPCYKDMAFWVSPQFTENNLCELVRGVGGDLVEEVVLIDEFTNKKTGRTSNCFRITYRSMERSLTDDEVNGLQERVREGVAQTLGVELR